MKYQITVRYADGRQRYDTFSVTAASAADALRMVADKVSEATGTVDLVEMRVAVDPDHRVYAGEEEDHRD